MAKHKKPWHYKKRKATKLNDLVGKKGLKKIYIPNRDEQWYSIEKGELPNHNEIVLGQAKVGEEKYYGFFRRVRVGDSEWEWGICDTNHVACNGLDEFDTSCEHNIIKWMFIGKDGQ